jgi:hypothetical protein
MLQYLIVKIPSTSQVKHRHFIGGVFVLSVPFKVYLYPLIFLRWPSISHHYRLKPI